MTKTEEKETKQSITSNNSNNKFPNYKNPNYYSSIPIPSREDFHRYTSNLITENDFLCPGRSIQATGSAIRWTIGHSAKIY